VHANQANKKDVRGKLSRLFLYKSKARNPRVEKPVRARTRT